LNTRTYLAIFLIATSIAIGTTTSLAIPAFADKDNADKGLEEADENIHENTGPPVPSDQDIRFHEGTCKGGHTTDALEGLGGCDELSEPGESENHP
jgi:hypothetical protein